MECPFCKARITADVHYCPSCGSKVDVTFEEIVRDHARQRQVEKARERVRGSRAVLMIAVFLFAVSVVVYFAIPAPPKLHAVPVYRVRVPAVEKMRVEEVEMPQFDIPE